MKSFVSWKEVEFFVDNVCRKYKDMNLTGVYGLPRGGLIFAVMISHKLHIPMLMAPVKNCLVIDDISDTGESLIHYKNSDYLIATMFYKKGSLVIPDYWEFEKNDKWIVYPWENPDD